jgi:hypothetical protein
MGMLVRQSVVQTQIPLCLHVHDEGTHWLDDVRHDTSAGFRAQPLPWAAASTPVASKVGESSVGARPSIVGSSTSPSTVGLFTPPSTVGLFTPPSTVGLFTPPSMA